MGVLGRAWSDTNTTIDANTRSWANATTLVDALARRVLAENAVDVVNDTHIEGTQRISRAVAVYAGVIPTAEIRPDDGQAAQIQASFDRIRQHGQEITTQLNQLMAYHTGTRFKPCSFSPFVLLLFAPRGALCSLQFTRYTSLVASC